MAEADKKKSSCLLWIVIGIILVALLLTYGKHMKKQKTSGMAAQMHTPADAAMQYIKMVNKVKKLSTDDLGVDELLQTVTKSDRKWFMDNQSKIYKVSRGGLNDFIGYKSTSPLEESVGAIMAVVGGSPDREDAQITSQREEGERAALEIEQGTAYGGKLHYTVELKKEGGLWKVEGFCGAREELERQIAGL